MEDEKEGKIKNKGEGGQRGKKTSMEEEKQYGQKMRKKKE